MVQVDWKKSRGSFSIFIRNACVLYGSYPALSELSLQGRSSLHEDVFDLGHPGRGLEPFPKTIAVRANQPGDDEGDTHTTFRELFDPVRENAPPAFRNSRPDSASALVQLLNVFGNRKVVFRLNNGTVGKIDFEVTPD